MATVASVDNTTSFTSRTVSTGSNGFDTKLLVEARLAPQTSRISKLKKDIDTNRTALGAYQDLQKKLQSLDLALTRLRADPSSAGKSTDVFLKRRGYLTMSPSGTATNYLTASAKDGTSLGNHAVTITQIAKVNIVASASQPSKTAALGWSGGFSLGVAGGKASKIAVTADMSLSAIADAINAEKGNSGVGATVMLVTEGKYKLVLTASDTGKAITASEDSGGTLLSSPSKLGLLNGSGAIKSDAVLQTAQNAVFSVDGVAMTRTTNDIADVLEGVTLHLLAAPPSGATLGLEVANDLDEIKKAVTGFVEAYNAVRDIVIANQATKSNGTADDSAVLFGDANLRAVASAMQNILSSNVGNDSLRTIGISLDSKNKLVIDDIKLSNTLLNTPKSVESLFSYKMTASSGDLGLIRHPDAGMEFTLDVSVDKDGKLTGARVGGNAALFTVSGHTIRGVAGTPYEGLTLVYTGNTSKTISVKLSQGLADRMHYAADKSANSENGSLMTVIGYRNKTNNDLTERVNGLTASTQNYANYLFTAYARMAARISQAQTTINLLKALLNASNR